MSLERLQKVIARAGVASRRAAEALIAAGRVRVDGRVVRDLGARADPRRARVEVDGRRLAAEAPVYVVLHKPRGVVSTMDDPEGRPTVRDLVASLGERVFPVGRLDFATSGVLLLTNDGAFAHGLLHPGRDVPKTYVVKVAGEMSDDDVRRWAEGVDLPERPRPDARGRAAPARFDRARRTRPARVRVLRRQDGKTWLAVTLFEGQNRQVRRMGDATGFRVMRLSRVAFANVTAEGLRPGEWRHLGARELRELRDRWGVPQRVPRGLPPREEARRNARPTRGLTRRGPAGSSRGGREDRHGRRLEPRDAPRKPRGRP